MGAKYWAEVSHHHERRVIVLVPYEVAGGKWRIGLIMPNHNRVGWRGNTGLFESEAEAQAALDAEAQTRGLKPVREV